MTQVSSKNGRDVGTLRESGGRFILYARDPNYGQYGIKQLGPVIKSFGNRSDATRAAAMLANGATPKEIRRAFK